MSTPFEIRYCTCGHAEIEHESKQYRGDKSLSCLTCKSEDRKPRCMHFTPASTEDDIRTDIAKSMTGRCQNCYRKLEGYNVQGPGWNWVTVNLGPFCDSCFAEFKSRDAQIAKLSQQLADLADGGDTAARCVVAAMKELIEACKARNEAQAELAQLRDAELRREMSMRP